MLMGTLIAWMGSCLSGFSHGVALMPPPQPLSFPYFLEGSYFVQPTCKVGELGSISWAEGQGEVCTYMIWCSACEICLPYLFICLTFCLGQLNLRIFILYFSLQSNTPLFGYINCPASVFGSSLSRLLCLLVT